MVEDSSEQYVSQLCKYLHPLPVSVRLSAVRQVAQQIDAYRAAGRPWGDIIAQLPVRNTQHRRQEDVRNGEGRSGAGNSTVSSRGDVFIRRNLPPHLSRRVCEERTSGQSMAKQ